MTKEEKMKKDQINYLKKHTYPKYTKEQVIEDMFESEFELYKYYEEILIKVQNTIDYIDANIMTNDPLIVLTNVRKMLDKQKDEKEE